MAQRFGYLISILIFFCASAHAQVSLFESVRSSVLAEKPDEALAQLTDKKIEKLDKEEESLAYFTRGYLRFEEGKYDEAAYDFGRSIQRDSRLSAYAHYYIGRVAEKKGNLVSAKRKFDKVLDDVPNRELKYQSRHHLGRIAIKERHWRTAYKHYRYLEKRWRYESNYPEILWGLVKIELNRKRKWRACRWARKLYYRYPVHDLVKHWGIDLQQAEFEGKKLGCVASPSDQERRIRRLQYSGASDRARQELETLRKRSRKAMQYDVDEMFATYMVNEGYVDEAINILMPHYLKQNDDYDFLSLLAKAAGRAGRYQTAMRSYLDAFKLKRRTYDGRRALFRAAFLSYQYQDYDGAVRRFEEFLDTYKRTSLRRPSMWYLAWVRYLKGDYQGSYDDFAKILDHRKRNWRYWRDYSKERIRYWMAMSLMRMQKHDEAREVFESLAADPLMGYYAVASLARLQNLPQATPPESTPMRTPAQSGEEAVIVSGEMTGASQMAEPGSVVPQPMSDEEAEEKALKEESEKDSEEEVAEETGEEVDEESQVEVTTFKDPKLRKRFARARDLISVGLNFWGRWELYEIERRTRNESYLRMLMGAYEGIGSYHRSTYISDIHFGTERQNKGMAASRDLWEFAYPKAFDEHVSYNAKYFALPSGFVWAIMRAESRFRPDIQSPVGAKGLMQLMPHTARQVSQLLKDKGVDAEKLTDPATNIRLGTRYLHRLGKKFNRLIPLMAAGYNAGPHRVERWLASFGNLDMDEFIEHIPFTQTRDYAKKIVRYYSIYTELYGEDKNKAPAHLAWLSQPMSVTIPQDPATRETWEPL